MLNNKRKCVIHEIITDTDSLAYEIEAEDVPKELWKDKHKFDFSDYPKDSPFYDNTNK